MTAEFAVGAKVVHPHHGAGTVICISQKGLGERRRTYYVIETLVPEMTLMVPVGRADDCGLRLAESTGMLLDMLTTCADSDVKLQHDFRKRRDAIGIQICSGEFETVAEAVHHLRCLREERRLSETDRRMLDRGTDLLVSEFAISSGIGISAAEKRVDDVLSGGAVAA